VKRREIRAKGFKHFAERVHLKTSYGSDADSKLCLFYCDFARASLRIWASMVSWP